jgi:hypothetical protein
MVNMFEFVGEAADMARAAAETAEAVADINDAVGGMTSHQQDAFAADPGADPFAGLDIDGLEGLDPAPNTSAGTFQPYTGTQVYGSRAQSQAADELAKLNSMKDALDTAYDTIVAGRDLIRAPQERVSGIVGPFLSDVFRSLTPRVVQTVMGYIRGDAGTPGPDTSDFLEGPFSTLTHCTALLNSQPKDLQKAVKAWHCGLRVPIGMSATEEKYFLAILLSHGPAPQESCCHGNC